VLRFILWDCKSHYLPRTELTNPWQAGRFPWHAAFTTLQIFYFFSPTNVSILWIIYIYIYIYIHIHNIYIYTHIGISCLLSLLPNKTARNLFTQIGSCAKSGWIFIIGAPAWRWMGEYVTLDKTFYNRLFKQEVEPVPVTSKFTSLSNCSRRPLLE